MSWSIAFMVVMIVLITAIAKSVRRSHERDHGHGTIASAEAAQAQADIRQLKERIAVLERVVTENHGSLGLDREIERLRDR